MKQQNITDDTLPYERFILYGKESLSNAELIAIILRTGTRGCSALDLARKILQLHESGSNSLQIMYDLKLEELKDIPGIGEVKAVKLLCIAELARRLSMESAGKSLRFTSPSSIADYYMETLRHKKQEVVLLLLLDNHLRLIREVELSRGTVNSSLLSPRNVFIEASRGGAVYIVLLHNHPSGDPTPSPQDIEITTRICELGKMMEIELVDHLIIGDKRYTSMKESGNIF